jgi:hypothetical protein
LNSTFSVSSWPGLNVAGNTAPGRVKPEPVSVATVIVSGSVPVEVKVKDCVAGVLTGTSPKETELEDALRTPEPTAFTTKPPQPDKTKSTLQQKMMSRALHQTLRGRI